MKVSIITPAHNSGRYIGETIGSVLAQTYSDWELLITDDASEDDTVEKVERFMVSEPRIKLFRLENHSGPAVARNHSIQQAKGRFIAFLDSDDRWTPDKLEKQVKFMVSHHRVFTFTSYYFTNEEGSILGSNPVRPQTDYNDLLKTCDIGCLTAMYDTSHLGLITMPLVLKSQDYALWLKILKITPYAYSLPEPLGYYRMRPGSVSRNKFRSMLYIWKIYRETEQLPWLRSAGLMITYTLNGFRRYSQLKRN
jgi:glycosyltransferase involved in cell wall biosynthesis